MNTASEEREAYGDLLGSQHYDIVGSRRPANGPRSLMFAVLEDGIRCYLMNISATRPSRRTKFDEAKAWIENRNDIGPFAFETLCNTFDIDADKLRGQLSTMSVRKLPRRLLGASRPRGPRVIRTRRKTRSRLTSRG